MLFFHARRCSAIGQAVSSGTRQHAACNQADSQPTAIPAACSSGGEGLVYGSVCQRASGRIACCSSWQGTTVCLFVFSGPGEYRMSSAFLQSAGNGFSHKGNVDKKHLQQLFGICSISQAACPGTEYAAPGHFPSGGQISPSTGGLALGQKVMIADSSDICSMLWLETVTAMASGSTAPMQQQTRCQKQLQAAQ